jgi:hypothetical protein
MRDPVRRRADRAGHDDPAGYRAALDGCQFNAGSLDVRCAKLREAPLLLRGTGAKIVVDHGFFLCRRSGRERRREELRQARNGTRKGNATCEANCKNR